MQHVQSNTAIPKAVVRSALLMFAVAMLAIAAALAVSQPAHASDEFGKSLTFSSSKSFNVSTGNSKTWDGTLEYYTSDKSWKVLTSGGSMPSAYESNGKWFLHVRGVSNTVITGDKGGWIFSGSENVSCTGSLEYLLDYNKVAWNYHPEVGKGCFANMFAGWSKLIEAPDLPTKTAERCYYSMFYTCTSLRYAPSIPATELPAYSCVEMFAKCTALTSAPTLSEVTVMGNMSCAAMFSGCTKLESVPDLPKATVGRWSCEGMFSGCTALTTAPALPSTDLNNYCYGNMFSGCTSLTKVPALPATTLASSCYSGMFADCTSLQYAPALSGNTLASSCYSEMFKGCTSLKYPPSLPATNLEQRCYSNMFAGCSALIETPALPAMNLAEECYINMFNGCTALTKALALPANNAPRLCYSNMFSGCNALYEAPLLPATTLGEQCYSEMFSGCTSLSKAPALPAMSLADQCYSGMFSGCTTMKTVPALPATTLPLGCYREMFSGCSSLEISATKTGTFDRDWRIPSYGDSVSVTAGWNESMFAGTGGTFTSDPNVGTTYYVASEPVSLPLVARVELSSTTFVYDGIVKHPDVTAFDSSGNVMSSELYTVSYAGGCTLAGTYEVTVEAKSGVAAGTVYTSFSIIPTVVRIELATSTYTYSGRVMNPDPVAYDSLGEVIDPSLYTISYAAGRVSVGTYTITATGKEGLAAGAATTSFSIVPTGESGSSGSGAPVISRIELSASSFSYDGTNKLPAVTVYDTVGKVLDAKRFTVAFAKDSASVGTYAVTVTAREGAAVGTAQASYTVVPKGAKLKKPTALRKALKVKWAKQSAKMTSSRISGYQVRWSTDKKFSKKKTKAKKVKGYKRVSLKIKKLKSKKKYYIQIRTYMKAGGKTYWSSWSKTKSAKAK